MQRPNGTPKNPAMQLRCQPPRIYAGLRMNRRNFLASVAVDFPGDTLLHCHQALHMDFGFMQTMKYVG
jgi:FtsP/CotA-like multicopper oxidase with cupredoxin domain